MTKQDNHHLLAIIENEGFDYTFYGYDRFLDIKDADFHKLRKAYLKARNALAEYVGDTQSMGIDS